MTKVQAIVKVMEAAGGSVFLCEIYEEAGKYYKGVDAAKDWKAGLRGVLYREIRNGRTFTKSYDMATGVAMYGLKKNA